MSQQFIDFGAFPDDPDADAIRTAFEKVQQNFTELFNTTTTAGVDSVNRIPGAGVTVSSPIGNVIITANIACVQFHTSTLSIGRGANGGTDASITESSQVLWIDLPDTLGNIGNLEVLGNANIGLTLVANAIVSNTTVSAAGNGTFGNLSTAGNINGANIIASQTITGANLNLSGTLSVVGNANVNNLGVGNIIAGNVNGGNLVSANYLQGTLITAAQPNITSLGTLTGLNVSGTMSVVGNSNVGNLGTTGVYATTLSATGNANVGNIGATGVYATTLSATGNANVGNIGATEIGRAHV